MKAFISNPWIAIGLGLLAFVSTAAAVLVTHRPPPAEPSSTVKTPGQSSEPSWQFHNPEMDQLIQELRSERESYALRRAQLDELATRLKAEKQEIDQTLDQIKQMQRQFDDTLLRITTEESAQLKKSARTYAAMEPDSVARVFKEMDDKAVVRVMAFMKDTERAPIFESLARLGEADSRRVGEISERLRLVTQDSPAKPKP